MPENSTEGGCVQTGKLAIDYHKGVVYSPGMNTTDKALRDLAAKINAKWESAPISMRRNSALDAAAMLLRWLAKDDHARRAEAMTYASAYL